MLEALREFTQNDKQRKILEAVITCGSNNKASKLLGCVRSTVDDHINRIKHHAAQQGYSPQHGMTKTVPDGFKVRGVSTLYNDKGEIAQQWVKSSADAEAQAVALQAAVAAMCEDIPKASPVVCTAPQDDHLCTVYTLTDSHIGSLAWGVETKSGDWDLDIAERTLTGCFASMVAQSPHAKTCVIAQLGDFLHYDSALAPVTPLHGNVLDADGRMPKMVRVAIRILRKVVALALAKHDKVVLLLAEGNHDITSSVWLRAMFQALYENEPRIEIIDSELPYYVYEFGSTMLAWHHGHLAKNTQLPILFAAQFPHAWGHTTKRYAHCGHKHHVEEKEHSGMTVIQHPTLAARDAYAARGGWISERQCTSITYSSKHGQVARTTVTPEMLA